MLKNFYTLYIVIIFIDRTMQYNFTYKLPFICFA